MGEESGARQRNDDHRRERRRDHEDHASGSDTRRREDRSRRDGGARRDRSQEPRSRRSDDPRDRHGEPRGDKRSSARRGHSRSRSPPRRRRESRSPPTKKRRPSHDDSRSPPPVRSRAPLPSQDDSFRGEVAPGVAGEKLPEKQKPNYKPTGLLAKEANTVKGTTTVLKYHEPPEARKPSSKDQWRMYVFKKKDLVDTIYLHQRSVWLMGRDEKVTDLHLEHPSISKQHAVIQFRYITTTDQYGDKLSKVKPYLIDLESANGTKLNGKKVAESRYVELVDQDVVSFGDSEREYVLMLPDAK